MQRIMLATDFSERSDRALRRAVILARQHGAALDILHVVDEDRPRPIVNHEVNHARQLLGELALTLKDMDSVVCTTGIRLDDPFVGIVKAAAEAAPDLLVIGRHRRQVLRDAFVGTTAERTIRTVHCPVLMANGPPVGLWRHVLMTTDLSEHAVNALRRFLAGGIAGDATRSLLYVFDVPALRLLMSDSMGEEGQRDYLENLSRKARQELAQFIGRAGIGQAERIVRHEETTVADEILKTAGEVNADLIVISTQGKGAVSRMVLGSVATQVLRDAQCDVLVMPTVLA
ncbi:universal stress protein [Paracoccus benzoatiresistens]|uniref:Universal stress protein n=1 Tax=Paracoccus benzoatiresistens TaxID=2997341 RepID=A0ABT4J8G4_9RHOB|nr:universal stress protein [Paracoccus sp. EF6]MCZ0963424.1 universal stress protein [Paracoccus sp. EF6]